MNISTETLTIETPRVIKCTGKGARKREQAFCLIAPLSLLNIQSREDMLSNLELAMGDEPGLPEIEAARDEHIIGRVSLRCDGADDVARLNVARDVVLNYAMPGTKKLPEGKTGTRTAAQQTACNAARKHFSDALASIVATTDNTSLRDALRKHGYGGAMTQRTANKKKRAAATAGSTNRGKAKEAAPAPKTSTVAPPVAATELTARDCVDHVCNVLAGLARFSRSKDGAKHMPAMFGEFVERINGEAAKLAGEYAELNAKANSKRKN